MIYWYEWLALGLALLEAVVASVALGITTPRREPPWTIEWPPTYAELLASGQIKLKRKRHNLHCGHCGRFAKKTPLVGVGECRYHGLTVRAPVIHPLAELDVMVQT